MKSNQCNKNISLLSWLSYIKKIYPTHNIDSLDRVILVAKKLKIFKNMPFVITVTGTNGKGSTCCLLENIFLYSGYHVGLYTSPHILYYYERIRINGIYLTNSTIHINIFKKIEKARGNILLTDFEFITLSALLIFKYFNLDIIILEVGIGGRFDATNIINADIAVITNISFDHIKLLGNTRNNIGYEKSGIFRKNIPVIIGDYNIPYSVYKVSNKLKIFLNRILYEWGWIKNKKHWTFYDKYGSLTNLPIPKIDISNAAIAIASVRSTLFNIKTVNIIKSLKNIFLIGRFHIIFYRPYIILDVAHNPSAANLLYKKLREFLIYYNTSSKVHCIIGMIMNKDIQKFIFILSHIVNFWYYAPLKTSKGISINILKKYLPKNSFLFSSIENILSTLINKINKKDIILICGSFYTVSEAIIFIRNKYNIYV